MDEKTGYRIAVLIERSRAYGRRLCEGVAAYALRHRAWHLTLIDGHDLGNSRKMRGFDGFICRFLDTRVPRKVLRYDKPIVDVYHDRPLAGIAAVDSDHCDIGRAAAEHLLERHFTRFAFCGHNGSGYSDGRFQGFAETVKAAGFDCLRYKTPTNVRYRFNDDTVFSDPTQSEGDEECLRRWVASLPKPIAVFCSHDFRAYQLVQCCARAGVAVPAEVAVVGVDDDALLCSFTSPTISSVDPDAFGVGYAAAETLDALLRPGSEKPDDATPRYVPCKGVVARESTDIHPIKPDWLSKALLYIQHNVANGVSAADVCQYVGRSHTLVARLFKEVLNSTLQDEIAKSRLREAKRLIDAGLPPVRAAALSGYKSLSYFSNCFKRAYGKPPSRT